MNLRPLPPCPGEPSGWEGEPDARARVALLTGRRSDLGRWGEEQAAALVEWRGGRVLERNYRCGALELDLIFVRDGALCFGEVRCRRSNALQQAADTLGRIKFDRFRRAARTVVETMGWTGFWQLDFFALDVTMKRYVIRWYENVEEGSA